jgi:hypothetical protein
MDLKRLRSIVRLRSCPAHAEGALDHAPDLDLDEFGQDAVTAA